MSLLSVSIVNVVLPSIGETIGASTSALQWVLSGYTLAFGVLLVPGGRAGDVLGRGRLFVLGVVVFALASLAAGFAPNALVLNIARVFMGFGSGLLNPQTVGLIQQYFHGAARGRAFGVFGSVVGVSVAIGPVLGGLFIALAGAEWGWRLAFLVNVPIGVAAVVLAKAWFPPSAWRGSVPDEPRADGEQPRAEGESPAGERPRAGAEPRAEAGDETRANGELARASAVGQAPARPRVDLDPVGNLLLGLAILAVMVPFLEHAAGLWVYALLPVGIALVFAWVRWERRTVARGRTPMVDLALFRTRSFSAGTLLVSLYFMGVTSIWVVIAMFLQDGKGYSALAAGMIGLPAALCSIVAANVSGRLVTKVGRPLVVFGTAVCLLGLASSAFVVWLNAAHGVSVWWLLLTLCFVGIAQGSVISPNQTLSLAEVPVAYAGSAGGVLQTGQRIGTAIGIALITALFFFAVGHGGWDRGFMAAFAAIAVVVAAAGAVGAYDWVLGRREAARTAD
ncbi:MFS transporter [Brevibacterium sp. 5221]|uniref:MFS transporter n=2 Tax=Brevibacterium rongguiense TaxID=2695267 RepID=A0A6N9H5B4_9MICO|nr:MFS transporter [Brevibacterium rongguiense]